MALSAADLKIDHVTVAGASLDAMRQSLASVTNISAEYGGAHSNHATEMALVSFPDGSYLELTGIQANPDPAAVDAHVWSKFLRANVGPCAFALRMTGLSTEIADLTPAGRTRPDGVQLAWETVDAEPGVRGSLFPFLIRDITPRDKRTFPGGKPTTTRFGGIGKVIIGVQDLEGAVPQYRKTFNLSAPRLQQDTWFDADLAWFEGTPIVLARGLKNSSWLSVRVREYGDAPAAFLLTATGGMAGSGHLSNWFGNPIFWMDERQLGWRLGVIASADR